VLLLVESPTVKLALLLQHVLNATLLSTSVLTLVLLAVEIVLNATQVLLLLVLLVTLVLPSRMIRLALQVMLSPIAKP